MSFLFREQIQPRFDVIVSLNAEEQPTRNTVEAARPTTVFFPFSIRGFKCHAGLRNTGDGELAPEADNYASVKVNDERSIYLRLRGHIHQAPLVTQLRNFARAGKFERLGCVSETDAKDQER